jgi:hypothetical protein
MEDRKFSARTLIALAMSNQESYDSLLSEYLTINNERNLEPFILVWYDACVNDNDDDRQIQDELHYSINFIKIFNNSNECQIFIKEIKTEKVMCIDSKQYSIVYVFIDSPHYIKRSRRSIPSSYS